MLSQNLASTLGYPCSLRRFKPFFAGTHDSFWWFLKYFKFFGKTMQSGFQELRPYCKQSKIQSILEKKLGKNKQWLGNWNKKYFIVLKQPWSQFTFDLSTYVGKVITNSECDGAVFMQAVLKGIWKRLLWVFTEFQCRCCY